MKKVPILLFFLTANFLFLCAQPKYYEKSIRWQYLHNGWNIFEESNNTYLITGSNRDTFSQWNAYSCLINSQGEIDSVFQHNLPTGFGSTCNNGIKVEYGYVLSGVVNHNENPISAQCYVVQIAPDGSLIDTVWVGMQYSQSNCITRTPDGGYLLGGYSRQPTEFSRRPYLVRLNADMEVVWDSTYIIPTVGFGLGYFTELIADTTNNSYYALSIASYQPYDLVWLHLDDTGTILDHRVFPSTPYDWPTNTASISIWGEAMIRAKDGDFVLSISEIQLDDPIGCYLLKLSPDGDTVRWKKKIDTIGYISKIHQLADSSFILGGSVSALQPDDISLQGAVAHVSKDGDVLWKRIYGGTENDYIYDFTPTSDGGYFCTGRIESNLPNGGANVYLLKTNCMGLLTEPQAAFSATMDTAALTASFQNLSEFVYPDSIDGGHFIWDFGDGAVSSEISPTHTYAQGGNYTVTLTALVCSDTSVFVQEVSTWAVGLPQMGMEGFAVYPNPAQDHLVVENHSLEKSATFVLYDVLGRQVLSFTPNNQSVVPIEHLPSGVYLYQFINPQKNVLQQGKVSVFR